METRKRWDLLAAFALLLGLCTAGGYFSLMYELDPRLREFTVVGLLLLPIAPLYCGWAVYRSMARRDLRGGWMAWVGCLLLFLMASDFLRRLAGG